ncbi:biorientation of chromosomes in cell division protein 1-like 1 isoform X2 [Condylostylus longicornis]|nr:biorientation of chromosomes in cell division protein 1-like 1 isoform X2 [Condylostylus longicornis]
MADVDTKPAYQNLKQRVENTVTKFLSEQKWTPELNKNQMREKLRKHIIEAGFLDVGVQRIVDQVVNPKISTVFQPRIEDIVYKYLGIDKPELKSEPKNESYDLHESLTIHTDLLPNDLEAVSPDSDKSTAKFDTRLEKNYEIQEEHEEEDDESPPFEPLEGRSPSKVKEEDANTYSHLSGISGLTSQSGIPNEFKNERREEKNDSKEGFEKSDLQPNSIGEYAQESQLSQVSSNSRLSIVSGDDERNQKNGNYVQESSTNVDLSEEAQMPKFNDNSNSYHPPAGETLHFDIKKDEIKFEGTDRNNDILPPVYQSEMLERTDEKNLLDINRQMSLTQTLEEASNGTFNTESQNSTYFDDDSERGVLQIIEDPTQDYSREPSRPSSSIFQKPETKDEKNDENVYTNKQASDGQELQEKKCDIPENRSNSVLKNNNNNGKVEHYTQSKVESNEKSLKYDEKAKLSKSSSSNRHSTSSSSHKSHKSKDRKSDREKDKGRKSSSSDSKISSESSQTKNQVSSRHSTPLSLNSLKEVKEIKSNGSTQHKSTCSNKYASSSSIGKNEKQKSSERDRKRDYERSRDEKSSKSEKQKPKEYDDHSSEKNKRHHRKSTDSNDGDKKGYLSTKGQKYSKTISTKSSEDTKTDNNELNNQQNSTNTSDKNGGEVQKDIISSSPKAVEFPVKSPVKETLKFNMSNPIMIDNLNMENIEFIIGSNATHVQKVVLDELITQVPTYQTENIQSNEVRNDLGMNKSNVEMNSSSSILQKITTTDIILPINKNTCEKNRFESLISPPPKKRKYDMSFNSLLQNSNAYIPNIRSSDDDSEINLFGFDIQEEQENYNKIIKNYEEFYVNCFENNYKRESNQSNENIHKLSTNNSLIEPNLLQSTVNTGLKPSTNNNTTSQLCHEEFELKVIPLSSADVLNSKISPSLSDSSIGSKENEFSEKNNNKKNRGADIKKNEKKSNLQTLLASQRYTCDDLYKPRLSLSQRSRRRAVDNEI